MRAVTIILLVCFFVFDSLGVYFLFENKIHAAKSDAEQVMRGNVGKESFITIIISKDSVSQLSWYDDHEFLYKNELYDVVCVSYQSGQTVYTCYHDENERNITSAYISTLKRNMHPATHRNASRWSSWQADKYCSKVLMIVIHPSIIFSSCGDYMEWPLSLAYRNIPAQPPECGSSLLPVTAFVV